MRMLIGEIEAAGKDQTAIDEAYDKLLAMMKGGLWKCRQRQRGDSHGLQGRLQS